MSTVCVRKWANELEKMNMVTMICADLRLHRQRQSDAASMYVETGDMLALAF